MMAFPQMCAILRSERGHRALAAAVREGEEGGRVGAGSTG